MDIAIYQRVEVLLDEDRNCTGFVDGYDPISRRHHVNYGDICEWLWASPQRIKMISSKMLDHVEKIRSHMIKNKKCAIPPPFDPTPYELNKGFASYSKKMMNMWRISMPFHMKYLFKYNEQDLNDDDDELEDIDISTNKRRKNHNKKRKSRHYHDEYIQPAKRCKITSSTSNRVNFCPLFYFNSFYLILYIYSFFCFLFVFSV